MVELIAGIARLGTVTPEAGDNWAFAIPSPGRGTSPTCRCRAIGARRMAIGGRGCKPALTPPVGRKAGAKTGFGEKRWTTATS